MKWISRGLAVFSSGLAGIIVTSLMAVMGLQYLWRCYTVLLSPGLPFSFPYNTETGKKELKAQSFTIDPSVPSIELTEPYIEEVDKSKPKKGPNRFASASSITVTRVGEVFHGVARDLVVNIDKKGDEFNFVQFLPKKTPGHFGPGFVLDADQIKVTYEGKSNDQTKAVLKNVLVSQDKGDFVASGMLELQGLDRIPVELQLGPEGEYAINFDHLRGEAGTFLPLVRTFLNPQQASQFDTFALSTLYVDGHVQLISRANSDPDVRGQLQFTSPSVSYQKGQLKGRLNGTLSGSLQRTDAQATLTDRDRVAKFDGSLAISKSPKVAGSFQFRTGQNPWPILARANVKGLSYRNAKVDGWLSFADQKLALSGRGNVAVLRYEKERFDNISARVAYNGQALSVRVDTAKWRGGPVKASLDTDLKKQTLQGIAEVSNRPLAPLLKEFGVTGIQGNGSAVAVFGGGYKNPRADVFAKGQATVRGPNKEQLDAGPFEARINLKDNLAQLSRLTISGPNGILVASGEANLKSKVLDADFVAGAFPVSVLHPDATGTLFAKGHAFGTLQNPQYSARLEGYGVKFKEQGAALLVAEVKGDKNVLNVESLRANSGTGLLSANGRVDLKSKSIYGVFDANNLSISDWLGSEFLGTVKIENGLISGSFDNPKVSAKVTGEKVYAYGSAIGEVNLLLESTTSVLSILEGRLSIGSGDIVASGAFNLKDQTGSITANAKALPLERLFRTGPELALKGFADGKITAKLTSRGWQGSGNLQLGDVSVNDTAVGAGSIEMELLDNTVLAKGDIGSVDRFLSLTNLRFSLDERDVTADIAAYNMQVRDIIAASKPIWSTGMTEIPEVISTISGEFSGTASIHANETTWSIGESDLTLDNLSIAGKKAGRLVAKVVREGQAWSVPTLNWEADGATLHAKGSYDDNGQIDVDASLNDFDLGWANVIWPDTPLLTGKASVTVVAKGDKEDPNGRASILVDNVTVLADNAQKPTDPFSLIVSNLTFGNKKADLIGKATYQGFTGNISANVPYSSLRSDLRASRREPLSASIQFLERPIQDFREQLPDIDMDKSDGTVKLSANLTGLIEKLKVDASASLVSSKFIAKNLETDLNNLNVSYTQKDRKAHLTASAESGKGGKFGIDLNGNLADVFGSNFNVEELLDDSTLKGTVQFDQFAWSQKLPGAALPTLARLDGNFGIDGKFRTPIISGGVTVDQVLLNLPNEIIAGVAGGFSIDPILNNVAVRVAKGSKIETGVGALSVSGVGSLNGQLSEPDIRIPLQLDAGSFRLPSGRIALEPGGDLIFTYASIGGGEPVARVNLDLEGHTNVVSKRSTGQYESYQVTINIRGNALDEKSLSLTATSDPADLSQEEILALIGQRDLIQGIAQGVFGGGDNGFFRDAFYSIAIPNLSQNLTQGLVSGLNLDYLTVDYNPFDQFVLSAGKTIGKGLVLQATRQLQQTNSEALKWEVKLVYRLPVADRFFSRVRLAFGIDQSVPYKFSINWSRRF